METTKGAKESVDMKLEVVVLGVSDVDRAKAFYENLGWRLDADFATGDDFRVVQLTPHNSPASIIFGKGVTAAKPGSADSLTLAVNDVDAARAELIARGVDVSEVFHYAGGPFNNAVKDPRVRGRDPQGRSYHSFASFRIPTATAGCSGDPDAASRPRVEVDASTSHGRCNPIFISSGPGGAREPPCAFACSSMDSPARLLTELRLTTRAAAGLPNRECIN
jgi:catechol 2,3-dioxygenase-like lactoylglutathione lyase family enzyme